MVVISLFLENKAEFHKCGKLKRLKLWYSLSSCLFEELRVDQPLTDKQTDSHTNRQIYRQTDSHTNRQIYRQTDNQSDYYNPLVHAQTPGEKKASKKRMKVFCYILR